MTGAREPSAPPPRRIRILIALGTRPEAIKLAPVVVAARRRPDCEVILCSTGQHRELTRTALDAFRLQPDIDLDIMQPGQSLTGVTTAVLDRLGGVIDAQRPDWVVVQGDTTSAFAAALAAFYRKILVAHVEAGLRTGDIYAPWPEEMNRRLISELATLHCAPTALAAENLRRAATLPGQVVVTGNTVVDALALIRARLGDDAGFRGEAETGLAASGLAPHVLASPRLVLVTCHRRESFGAPLEDICRGLADVAAAFPDHELVFPLHPNPVLRATVDRTLASARPPNLSLIEPLGYLPFVALMLRARLLLTDSGGIQEEGVSLGTRVVVMREVTERTEGVDVGLARLAGMSRSRILAEVTAALTGSWRLPSGVANPYGQGDAGARIVRLLVERAP